MDDKTYRNAACEVIEMLKEGRASDALLFLERIVDPKFKSGEDAEMRYRGLMPARTLLSDMDA